MSIICGVLKSTVYEIALHCYVEAAMRHNPEIKEMEAIKEFNDLYGYESTYSSNRASYTANYRMKKKIKAIRRNKDKVVLTFETISAAKEHQDLLNGLRD